LGATGAKADGLPRHNGRADIEIVAKKTALPWPGTEGFVLSRSAQSMVKDFEQSHLIPPKMQTKLEISRQAELFPSSGFFQPRKVVLFCAIVRVAAE
jgi:hypothetical protein